MNKTIDNTQELILKGEALADYYQSKRDLAMYNIRATLASMVRGISRICLELEEREQVREQLEYLSTVIDSMNLWFDSFQGYYNEANSNENERKDLA